MEIQRYCALLTRSHLWALAPQSLQVFMAQSTHPAPRVQERATGKVMVLPIQGVLTRDDPWYGTTYNGIAEALDKFTSDSSIGRLVLAVDSPGGEVEGLPETAAKIKQAAQSKPVTAVVEGLAASAAYWLASQAQDIVAAPSAKVGSVGVVVMHADISGALEQAGIKITQIQGGKYKTEFSPFAPLTEDAAAHIQSQIDGLHSDFIQAVTEGRGARVTKQAIDSRFGEGRVLFADEARAQGMIDSVQDPRDFYKALIPPQETEQRFPIPQRVALERERSGANRP